MKSPTYAQEHIFKFIPLNYKGFENIYLTAY